MTPKIILKNINLKFPKTYSDRSLRNEIFRYLSKQRQIFTYESGLNNINLKLNQGDRLGIIGKNGSGKSTLLRVLSNIYRPDSGLVLISGKVLSMLSLNTGFDMELEAIENIYNISFLRGFKKADIDKKLKNILDFSELGNSAQKPLRTYSSGMIARLAASMILNFEGDILIFDEFISTGDSQFKKKFEEEIKKKIINSKIFVIASHDENLINKICNKVALIERGELKILS